MEENKVNFGEPTMGFNGYDFNSMTSAEMEECKGIISDIKRLLEE